MALEQSPVEHSGTLFDRLPEQNLHSLVRWHAEQEDVHRRLKEACIAELALRGLIQVEAIFTDEANNG